MKHFAPLILALTVILSSPVGATAFFDEIVSGVTVDNVVDVFQSGKRLVDGFEEFTPEQEYYIGRAVAAVILEKYRPYNNPAVNEYVGTVGQTVAQASDTPQIFGGYHFQVLDTSEINAFATPGGHVFITRGMLECCEDEDALAAVLAHEIGHIQNRHGIRTIKKSRINGALTSLAATGAQIATPAEVREITVYFEDSLADITETMLNSGYSREFEREADDSAVVILRRVGYDPNGLVEVLKVMDVRLGGSHAGFGKTHPDPADRIADAGSSIGPYRVPARPEPRQQRFEAARGHF